MIPLVRSVIEEDLDSEEPIPLPLIEAVVVEKVVEFLRYFKDKPYPAPIKRPLPKGGLMAVIEDEWYHKFIDLPKETVLDLVRAGNYLNVERVFEISCAKVGQMINKGTIEVSYDSDD